MPTHIDPQVPIHSYILLLQRGISIMMQPPLRNHMLGPPYALDPSSTITHLD